MKYQKEINGKVVVVEATKLDYNVWERAGFELIEKMEEFEEIAPVKEKEKPGRKPNK